MKKVFLILCLALSLIGCGRNADNSQHERDQNPRFAELKDSLQSIADAFPAEIGVAVITDTGDTLAINNEAKYPLMSVFKLHQAIALCELFDRTQQSLDSIVSILRRQLDPDTWSPMLKNHTEDVIKITIRELLKYTLTQSDNNASNWIFENLQPAADVDRYIETLIPRESFSIRYTEQQMNRDHALAYDNRTSPLGAAILINELYTSPLNSSPSLDIIRRTLRECKTGMDRIVAPLKDAPGVTIGHKTGSGYRNEQGILVAHNDVGFIHLPDGCHYTLAVFIKDFDGSDEDASKAISRISELVYRYVTAATRAKT